MGMVPNLLRIGRCQNPERRPRMAKFHRDGRVLPEWAPSHMDWMVRAAFAALRPGGQLLVWLYGREGNESYLRLALPLKRITTHIPHFGLIAVSHAGVFALDAYIAMCRFLPLPMRTYMREVLAKFTRVARRMTIYDQLNPEYAKYYTQEEARTLLASEGFENVRTYHRHGYSWTVIGTKPQS